ncbi:MAG: hypothetical protein GYA87_03230 [Christensenellaceae bacterium]|nr:hypothetical protein [Christensenellaceae bacterium]
MKYTKLFEDKLFLSVSKQSKLTAKQEVSLSDLRDQHLILIKKGFSNVYDKIRKVIEKEEPTIKITDCTENSVENACRLHALECCYLVPRLFESNNPNRTLLPVNFIDFISIGVIYRKASPQFIINQVIPLCSKVLQQI